MHKNGVFSLEKVYLCSTKKIFMMNTERRTIQLDIPQSDYALLCHLSHDNGWTIIDQKTEDREAERYRHAEEMARKIAFTEEDFQRMKKHDFFLYEAPEQPVYATLKEEAAALDAYDEEGYVSDEEVNHLRNLCKTFFYTDTHSPRFF